MTRTADCDQPEGQATLLQLAKLSLNQEENQITGVEFWGVGWKEQKLDVIGSQ